MEDVLEVYHQPYDPRRPLVCFDEGSKQQTKETRKPLPTRPGDVAKYDYEYERNGTSNLFVFFAPLEAWRHIKVTDRRTMIDFAHCMRDLIDIHFPEAEKIVLVMDNLNTHKFASLYEAFPPHRMKPGALSRSWKFTTHPSMAVGSIWLKLNSVFFIDNVSKLVCLIKNL